MSEAIGDYVVTPLLPEDPDGRYTYGVAADMKSAFESAATRVEEASRTRQAYVSAAREDFTGAFSEIFQANGTTATQDATALADALRLVGEYVRRMSEAGREEDERREKANEWVRWRDSRNWLEEHILDPLSNNDRPRPNMSPGQAPNFDAVAAALGSRRTPEPGTGGGGGGGGTSSARPSNLRTFAANSRALDSSLATTPGTLRSHLQSFAAQCYWGHINASGVVRAYDDYLQANEDDALWAVTVADAFAAAGGEGNVSTVSDAALAEALAAAGVSATRTALEIDPPTAWGAKPTTGYANDPVNTATGNFIEPETDLGFAGVASNLVLSRMYNSLAVTGQDADEVSAAPGVFGPGWSSVLDQHLVFSDEGCRWVMADGRAVDFPREGDGWGRAVEENYWLSREPADTPSLAELASVPAGTGHLMVVRDNKGSWWAYTLTGAWLGTGSGPGRTVSVQREQAAEGMGVVSRLWHVRGRFLDVEYVGGRVAVVRASDGRRVEYGYDDAGRLTEVTSAAGTRRYRINEAGLVDAVYSAAGVLEAENTYDASGRVVLQVTQHGRRTRFAYLPGRVTVVSDEDGTRSNSWIADARGRLVGVRDSHDERQSMAYDKYGNLVSFTERDGSVTVHAYDERGRRTRTVTPEGADFTYGWDEQDRLTTLVTDTGSVITYDYADEITRDPSVITDALGGRTELVWEAGLLVQVTDPAGVTIGFTYDQFGDLIATTSAAGDTAVIVRDQAGRPVEATTPSGALTRYTYTPAGQLSRRQDPDGAVWSFEHDPAGRLTAVIAPDGGRTTLEYAGNGELVRTIDPLGRAVERVFDDLGNVSAAVLPDGARWGFTHDSLSRLTRITDPAGNDWMREYDTVGNLTAVIDPTGVRADAATDRKTGTATLADAFASITYTFDEYGRPTRVQSEDGTAELVTYDAAGNPVELLDGEGGLTVLARDVAGRITSITSPTGAVTRYEYDNCGRPWRTIDPLGAVTELAYDADQRVIARTLPTGETETFTYDGAGRLTGRRTPGQGVARYGYDKVGRLTFAQDTWYGTRRFKYNTAGELIETINGVGGRTRFEYDPRGRLVKITDPLGGATTRTYTDTDQVSSVTDPLGRVTTATYDPAGRQLSQTDPDGNTTTWTYDTAGQETSTAYNGRLLAEIRRDKLNRRIVIADSTGTDGLVIEHELGFNRRGQLTSRTRGTGTQTWAYDADGHRTAYTDPTGTTTTYTRNPAGRLTQVTNPRLGEATFTYDASGRLTNATAGNLVQTWAYRHGYLAEHTRTTTGSGTDITLIGRDDDGRITGLTRAGTTTRYAYDNAGQLVAAATTGDGEPDAAAAVRAAVTEWEYDAGGRLVREYTPAGTRAYEYDAAGELTAVTEPDGARTEYVYDGLGRRTRLIRPDGSWTEYAWGPTGYLQETVDRTPDGADTARHRLRVDALGELAGVDGCDLWWDTANPIPTLAGIADQQVMHLPGGITGIGGTWTAPGWRAARPTDTADPWAVLGTPVVPAPGGALIGETPGAGDGTGADAGLGSVPGLLPAGIRLTAGGGLDVAGLEWLGKRAYDPAVRGFLSTDPLAPVLGAGWDGNPYAYAGNNPLHATDPTGLKPLTDADLRVLDEQDRGFLHGVGDWLSEYGEYVAGGAMIVAGGLLIASGVGGPAGAVLIAAGADTIIQKATTGEVNWGQVAVTGAVGLVAGPIAGKVGGMITSGLGRLGATQAISSGATRAAGAASSIISRFSPRAGAAVARVPAAQIANQAAGDGITGAVISTGHYLGTEEDRSIMGALGAAANGAVSNVLNAPTQHVFGRSSTGLERTLRHAVSSGSSVTGGFVEGAVTGEGYSPGALVLDAAGGAVVSDLGTPMGRRAGPTYTELNADVIVESGKHVIEENFLND
ncbi:Putative deoxyribonuclease RhsC [Arthrobacter saudimassiliensis]|uniref:Putative deoxyribonuclease RhsC n=1 Tax=Arthrobacter saudimassiliensis TaxID=1461584 RepID=A0A078MPI0_9MICC|nr:Putative deoxyribonuclease RhsC [Arthrobacter saudimassiliensis]